MRRKSAAVLALILVLSGCSSQPDGRGKAQVYYLAQLEGGAMTLEGEGRDFSRLSGEEWLHEALRNLSLPEQPSHSPLLEAPVRIRSVSLHGDTAVVDFNYDYVLLDDLDKSLLASGVALTLLECPQVSYVKITALGETQKPLLDRFFTAETVLLSDQSIRLNTLDATIYYIDWEYGVLVPQNRGIKTAETSLTPRLAASQLLSKPGIQELSAPFDPATVIHSIEVSEGICKIDLSDFPPVREELEVRLTVYSLVNTLCQLPEIDLVEVTVSGQPLSELGLYGLDGALAPEESLVKR